MQQTFTLKGDLANVLNETANAMKLGPAQLIGYVASVGLLSVSALPLKDHHREKLESLTGRFEFMHPELRDMTTAQEELPF